MASILTDQLTLSYGEFKVINNLDLQIPSGKITVFIGSNGCGKSTLLKSMARLLKPKEGSIILDGKDIALTNTKKVARKMAVLPQGPSAPQELTVFQLVKLGRYPHQNWYNQWSKEDERLVWEALEVTQLKDLANRPVESLSGGQRQRAWIAMTLAQNTDIIMLDEPTTFLDLNHQVEVLDILYDLNRNQKRTIIMVLHDLNLAARYADHMVAVANQTVVASGNAKDIMTCETIKEVFGMDCTVANDPLFGTPMCIPYGKGLKPNNLKAVL
ncbi:iron complex transport system ATP-binding protein [Natranaerovirga hydrolytica]|uniref:Iron complex transport system ATP-binding protein n=1 Tax=Natranaerovirga hydrolytica TaxID=680378 RepID=A0A4R1MI92_9FIRM|nr:ABC transporter ATP-binding protein [Natranaerovirga hydrolytica]TCK92408.1 iron complex transport system ATP-binding protein [Natranaerovirga hydrolytica]